MKKKMLILLGLSLNSISASALLEISQKQRTPSLGTDFSQVTYFSRQHPISPEKKIFPVSDFTQALLRGEVIVSNSIASGNLRHIRTIRTRTQGIIAREMYITSDGCIVELVEKTKRTYSEGRLTRMYNKSRINVITTKTSIYDTKGNRISSKSSREICFEL